MDKEDLLKEKSVVTESDESLLEEMLSNCVPIVQVERLSDSVVRNHKHQKRDKLDMKPVVELERIPLDEVNHLYMIGRVQKDRAVHHESDADYETVSEDEEEEDLKYEFEQLHGNFDINYTDDPMNYSSVEREMFIKFDDNHTKRLISYIKHEMYFVYICLVIPKGDCEVINFSVIDYLNSTAKKRGKVGIYVGKLSTFNEKLKISAYHTDDVTPSSMKNAKYNDRNVKVFFVHRIKCTDILAAEKLEAAIQLFCIWRYSFLGTHTSVTDTIYKPCWRNNPSSLLISLLKGKSRIWNVYSLSKMSERSLFCLFNGCKDDHLIPDSYNVEYPVSVMFHLDEKKCEEIMFGETKDVSSTRFLNSTDFDFDGVDAPEEDDVSITEMEFHSPSDETPSVFNQASSLRHGEIRRCGLKNIKNNCYMNSVMQCLVSLPQLRDYFIENKYMRELNQKHEWGLILQFGAAISKMCSSNEVIGLRSLKTCVGSRNTSFKGSRHQDAHEFLTLLLNGLETALEKKSMIEQMFGGVMETTTSCNKCMNTESTPITFTHLSVPVSRRPNATIEGCVRKFLKNETPMKYTCSGCKVEGCTELSTRILAYPDNLILHIKRFKNQRTLTKKLENHIIYDKNLLEIDENTSYRLVAVCRHKGEIESGHYIAVCRTEGDNWIVCDDENVYRATEEDVISRETYILFYIRL